eukprot:GHVS01027505.1.p1 GENE.GHVS01027505.1~~GHVS01027505.1.p1  ORF type:complete len:455 (-),score=16.96 GHVS01027505.1:58-1422(-)
MHLFFMLLLFIMNYSTLSSFSFISSNLFLKTKTNVLLSSNSLRCTKNCLFSTQIQVADVVKRTFNPIRNIVDRMNVKPPKDKPLLQLSIGDPTIYGNFKLPTFANEILRRKLESLEYNGYPSSVGTLEARAAVATKFSPADYPVTANDVVLTCGCSQALDITFAAIANPHTKDNILLPRPGFSLYETLCRSKGITHSFYDLQPSQRWEINLHSLELNINTNTKAILINNPSNPTGSVYSKKHLLDVIKIARKHNVLIISDEIYANMSFPGRKFHSLSSLSSNVPIIETGGIAKQYMVPGWRLGWAIVHDRHNRLANILSGLMSLSQLTLGPSSIIQSILPDLLHNTPLEYYTETMIKLSQHARVICEELEGVAGIEVIPPEGAIYAMVRVDTAAMGFESDVDFAAKLLQEQGVFVLPGQCFRLPGFIRLVLTSPKDKLKEAASRIREFCENHRK